MGQLKADIVKGWPEVLQDPTSAPMSLTVVQGMVCQREYHGLYGGGCEGMPDKPKPNVQMRGAI